MRAMRRQSGAIGETKLDLGLRTGKRCVGANSDLVRSEGAQHRIVVTRRGELRQAERAVVQNGRGSVVSGQQRFEFALVGGETAVHVAGALAQRNHDAAYARSLDL